MIPKVSLRRLPNGFRVLNAPFRSCETTTTVIAVRAGSRYETTARRGLAHLTEHVIFTGTENFPQASDFDRAVSAIGGLHNAVTGVESCFYYIHAPNDQAVRAAELIAEVVLRPTFRPDSIAKEQDVVCEELARNEDDELNTAAVLLSEMAFRGQPIGFDPGGLPETVRRFDRDDLVGYWRRHYVSGGMACLSVGGQADAAARAMSRLFGALPPVRPPACRPVLKDGQRGRVLHKRRDREVTAIAIGNRGVPLAHPARPAQEALDRIFGGGNSSRLYDRVIDQEGLAYQLTVSSDFFSDASLSCTLALVSNRNARRLMRVLSEEYRDLIDRPVTDVELSTAKAALLGALALDDEDHYKLAAGVLTDLMLTGKLTQPAQTRRALESVTLAQVRAVARRYYARERLNLVTVGPRAAGADWRAGGPVRS